MKNTLDTIFASSAGNGNIANTWKGIIVLLVGVFLPGTNNTALMGTIDSVVLAVGAVWTAYGLIMKLVRGRWSKPV